MHADQLTVSVEMVRELVDKQFPQWRTEPVRAVATQGTVNALFRIGERYAARLPLRPQNIAKARRWLEAEARAARELLGRTRFPTPEPVALGRPGAGYPMPWSVQSWLPGTVASDEDPAGVRVGQSAEFAHDLAEFIHGVRGLDTRGRTFDGRGRGGDLRTHDPWVQACFGHSAALLDVPPLRRIWGELRDLPRGPAADVMTHGDLIPGNVLVDRGLSEGRLAGVIDVGGLGPADPALDLVGAWHLLDAGPREVLRADLHCDDAEWLRGKGWAFQQAIGAVWYYVDSNPPMARMGRRTLERIMAEPARP